VAEGVAGATVFSAEVARFWVLEFWAGVYWFWLAGVAGTAIRAVAGE
jgi:hypothetical protein